jgi:hypothetical protein
VTDLDNTIRRALDALVPRFSGAEGDWLDVVRRALIDETRARVSAYGGSGARRGRRGYRASPPEEQGWGTRPLQRPPARARTVESQGWGTRPI